MLGGGRPHLRVEISLLIVNAPVGHCQLRRTAGRPALCFVRAGHGAARNPLARRSAGTQQHGDGKAQQDEHEADEGLRAPATAATRASFVGKRGDHRSGGYISARCTTSAARVGSDFEKNKNLTE